MTYGPPAAGSSGLVRWDGRSWSKRDAPESGSSFGGLWGSGARDVWLVGHRVHRWDGTTWARVDVPTRGVPFSVWGTSASDVFVTAYGSVSRFDGREWQKTERPEGNLGCLHGSAADEVWAVGGAGLVRWDGKAWSSMATNIAEYMFFTGVSGTSANDVWAVGDLGIRHRDARGWSRVPCDGSPEQCTGAAVWARSTDDAWIVGRSGQILRWNGARWSVVASPTTEALEDVWASGEDDAWAVGGGKIFHWDGRSWTRSPSPSTIMLTSIWGSGPRDVWAAGSRLLHWDGTRWTQVETAVRDRGGYGLFGFGASDVWLGGVEGLRGTALTSVQRWDGTRWTTSGSPFGTRALWGPRPGDLWAVGGTSGLGGAGRVRHLAGGRWTEIEGLVAKRVNSVWGHGKAMWIVGESGMILRRDL